MAFGLVFGYRLLLLSIDLLSFLCWCKYLFEFCFDLFNLSSKNEIIIKKGIKAGKCELFLIYYQFPRHDCRVGLGEQ